MKLHRWINLVEQALLKNCNYFFLFVQVLLFVIFMLNFCHALSIVMKFYRWINLIELKGITQLQYTRTFTDFSVL